MEMVSFDLIKKIRLHIQRVEKQAPLLGQPSKWMRITAALDVLEDTSWAIEYYCDEDYPSNVKGKYLFTYGLLQALFMQQDAVDSIYAVIFNTKKIAWNELYPDASKVREIRNDVVGHPTNRANKEFVHLAQCSMTKNGFYYIKANSERRENNVIYVDLKKVIEDSARCNNCILTDVITALDQEFENYINAHKERKMKEIFNMLHYAKEKALLDEHMGEWGYTATKEMVKKCEDELVLRYGSVEAVDWYKYLLEDIHELYNLIDNGIPRIPVDLQPGIRKHLLYSLFSKLDDLKSCSEETDAYFENGGKEKVTPEGAPKVTVIFGEEEFDEPEE